jgi:hypothetical protein
LSTADADFRELNDLIHTNARNAFDQGVKTERERIIKLLEQDPDNNYYALRVIKGEQK